MTAAEASAAIQRARDEVESVAEALPWPCTDLRPVAGQQLDCLQRGNRDPRHWTTMSPCERCRLFFCLNEGAQALKGAANWIEVLP